MKLANVQTALTEAVELTANALKAVAKCDQRGRANPVAVHPIAEDRILVAFRSLNKALVALQEAEETIRGQKRAAGK